MFSRHAQKTLWIGGGIILAGAIFLTGYRMGSERQSIVTVSDAHNPILAKADFSLFWDAVNLIKNKYVKIEGVKDQDFLYGAIRGAVGALDDPYSTFFKPSDAKKFEQDINGNFGGIGAEIGIRNGQLVVIAPLKGNPAEKVGLLAGDAILKVGDTATNDLSVDDAVKLIRGEIGTEVKLFIFREGWKEGKEFVIVRRTIVIPTLDWQMKPGKIAYIQLYNFNANAASLFAEATLSALIQGARGVVLDLRNNPGGYLDVANNISGWFLKKGDIVVSERFYDAVSRNFRSTGNGAFSKIPVVILVNGGSASASEIVAGALRDNRNIKLIGEKTFGKGTVQEIQTLKDDSTLKVSVAEWLTPLGHEIDKKGLTPDIEIKLTEKDIENKRDPQLEKALEIIKIEIGQ